MEEITIKEISNTFSSGKLNLVYPYFDDNIQWKMIGAPPVSGKENVIAYCEKMLPQMAGSTLNNTNLIVTDDTVVIQGSCSYINQDNTPGKVEYCDIYRFNDKKLLEITSYLVETKSGSPD